MSATVTRISKLVLAVVVAAGLTFGVAELRAGSSADCDIDYSRGQVGYCVDHEHCTQICSQVIAPWSSGVCTDNCCQCMVR